MNVEQELFRRGNQWEMGGGNERRENMIYVPCMHVRKGHGETH
jgi:hypothetical protein